MATWTCRLCGVSYTPNKSYDTRCNHCRNEGSAQRKRLALHEYKAAVGCAICGEKDPVVLDPHHLDPETKHRGYRHTKRGMSQGVADIVNSTLGTQRLIDELAKCVILCKNCHARVHAGTAEVPQ